MESPCIMLAENDEAVRRALTRGLTQRGHQVISMVDDAHVKEYIDDCVFSDVVCRRVNALVTDLNAPHIDGLSLLSYVRDLQWDLPVIVLRARDDEQMCARARELGALAILDKPIALDALEAALREACPDR